MRYMCMKITNCPSARKANSENLLLLPSRSQEGTCRSVGGGAAPAEGVLPGSLRAALTRPGGRCCLGAVPAPVYPESPAGAGPGTLQPVKEAEDGTEMWTL